MTRTTLPRLPKFARFLLTACMFAWLSACQTPPPPAPIVQQPKAPPPAPAPDNSAELARNAAFQDLVVMQDRLYLVAAPLLLNNTSICPSQYLLGFTAKNKYSYTSEFVDSAAKILDLGDQLQIMGVTPGSGAASVGLKNRDKLVAIGDVQLPQGPSAEMQAHGVLASLLQEKTSISVTINRNGQDTQIKVPLTHACAFSMELGNTDLVNAYADGRRVLLTRGMMKTFTSSDDLAMVIASEMGRNAVKRTDKQRAANAMSDIIDNLSRVHPDLDKLPAAKPSGEESDMAADKRALFMLARAAYPFEDYVKFWTRISAPNGPADAYAAQHPLTPRRQAAMTRVIGEIKDKQAKHKAIQP